MQNISETVPNAQFPFGQPLRLVKQKDRSQKDVFILGVYGSAVYAWFECGGHRALLPVASEPVIFWDGKKTNEIPEIVPPEGKLELAKEYNGFSGKTLDKLYLEPLGLTRSNVWLCDLIPYWLMEKRYMDAIQMTYNPLREKYRFLPAVDLESFPKKSRDEKPEESPCEKIVDADRRKVILTELEEAQTDKIILLGNDPLKWFLSCVSNCKKTHLSRTETYGSVIPVIINDKPYKVMPLTHPRQASGIDQDRPDWDPFWYEAHKNWVANVNSRK